MKQSNNKISIPHQEAIQFPKDVQIGKYYRVPCIRLPVTNELYSTLQRFIPISTYLHEDSKIINFKEPHWHVDWRFAGNNLTSLTKIEFLAGDVHTARAQTGFALTISNVIISTVEYHTLKCKRHYLTGLLIDNAKQVFKPTEWVFRISKHFCNSKLKEIDGQLICPHKGAIIDKNCTDEHGNYVCPAHMLRFNPVTLQVVTDPEKEETNFDNFLSKKNI